MISDANRFSMTGGKGFIEVGTWRFGMHDHQHFVFSNRSGYTSVIYRGYDGTIHAGPRQDYTLWDRPNSEIDVKLGPNYLEFGGVWRLAEIDKSHLSLGHLSTKTCMIWRVDGTKHPGPRTDYNGFSNTSNTAKIGFGPDFVEIGNWRIGATDSFHLSIGTKTVVSEILRSDGTSHPGPRMDFRIEKEVLSWIN